jgi:hypothetical protein
MESITFLKAYFEAESISEEEKLRYFVKKLLPNTKVQMVHQGS